MAGLSPNRRNQLQPLLLPVHAAAAARGIEADIRAIDEDIVRMLAEVTGSNL
jgi:hypothetical protein